MNKALTTTAMFIMILSLIALVYFASHPLVNPCASPDAGHTGLTVCIRQESTNWIGIAISFAALASGITLTVYNSVIRKREK